MPRAIVQTAPRARPDRSRRRLVTVTTPDGRAVEIVSCYPAGLVQAAVWIGSGSRGTIARAAEATGIEASDAARLVRVARP